MNLFKKVSEWLFVGKRLPILLVSFIVIACTIIVVVVSNVNKQQTNLVTAFVTVKGIDGVEIENRQIKIEDGESVENIFSLKYEDIYESFGRPLIQYNVFQKFMGVRATNGKSFHVTIDGIHDPNLKQAFVYGGQTLVIEYK